ncbi:hypothetical protein [Oleiharenicola sp. Vm1]|uniref:TPM domain-containing protein n=1 Tax=Oleiharenicola sp. Vm1 TaxID=3398393 RepID=UPI0039F53BDC
MKRLLLFLLVLAAGLRAAEAPRVSDPSGVLPPAAVAALEAQAVEFERATGVQLRVAFHAQSPTAQEDEVPGAYMKALAGRIGTAEGGVLAVYFADDPDWRLWIGDALTERFARRKGTVAELTENRAIHDAKEAVFAAAKAKADAAEKDRKSPRHLEREAEALIAELQRRFAR